MFGFSIAHHWIFDWRQYADGSFKEIMETRYHQLNDNQEDTELDNFTIRL